MYVCVGILAVVLLFAPCSVPIYTHSSVTYNCANESMDMKIKKAH